MYYLTTTIDEYGMADIVNEVSNRINGGAMRKRQPFGIVRTEEPLNAETMPGVMVSTFYLVLTGEANVKNEKQAAEFMAAMTAAAEEIERMNEANYVIARQATRPRH